jgi:hypothetical protein
MLMERPPQLGLASSMASLQLKHPQLEPVHYQQILKAIITSCLLAFNKSSMESSRHQCHLEDATPLLTGEVTGVVLNRSTIESGTGSWQQPLPKTPRNLRPRLRPPDDHLKKIKATTSALDSRMEICRRLLLRAGE